MSPHFFMLRAVVGRSLVHLRQIEAGLAEMRAALKWAEDIGYRVLAHLPRLFLSASLLEAGDAQQAVGAAKHALEMAQDISDRWAEAVALRTLAEVEIRLPRPDWSDVERRLLGSRQILREIRAPGPGPLVSGAAPFV